MKLEHVQRTHTGLVRETNQDSILSLPELGAFLVADGMGGEQAGDEASQQVAATVRECLTPWLAKPPDAPSQVEALLTHTLLQANKAVYQIALADSAKSGMGSTGSLLLLYRGVYFIAHVGDSRIYMVRGGEVTQLSRDHTLVGVLFEQGAITREQMETHPDRHLLTQCLGANRPIRVDTTEGKAQPGDLFLLCSDGLTGYAGEVKVRDILLHAPRDPEATDGRDAGQENLEDKANRLLDAALDGGGGDNVSLILARVLELDPADDWEPEDTAPLPKLHDVARDTLINTELMSHTLPPPPEQRHGRRRMIAGVCMIAVALILSLALLLLPRSVKLYLNPVGAGDKLEASPAGQPMTPQVLEKDEKGYFIRLAGPGAWRLRVKREGYADYYKRFEIDRGVRARPLEIGWVELVPLTLQLPAAPQPDAVEVTANDPEVDYKMSRAWDAAGLNGQKTIELQVPPDIVHIITARNPRGGHFSARVSVPAGGSRTVRIFFGEAAPVP